MRRTFPLAALIFAGCVTSSAPADPTGETGLLGLPGPTVVYVVRHAEKVDDPGNRDPDLTLEGRERADELARVVGDLAFDALYTTPYARNVQTITPLAKALGLAPEVVDAKDTRGLADRILAVHPGQRVLIVGHSNTVPELLAYLGIPETVEIHHGDYDDLFVVVLVGDRVQLEHLHYGAVARDPGPEPRAQLRD